MAILAGFEATRGEIVVTLDADKILRKKSARWSTKCVKVMTMGSIRRKRQDSAWRTYASKAMNRLREKSASKSPIRAICCAPMVA
jgi:undecaprenyl-phosphate 4-deoxy-4-formamido-L-arabinose transferase